MNLIRAADVSVEPASLREGYHGDATIRRVDVFTSEDEAMQVGIWECEGTLVNANPGLQHQAWILLRGEMRVEMEGDELEARAGDVIVFEAPYAPKTLYAGADLRIVWVAAKQATTRQGGE